MIHTYICFILVNEDIDILLYVFDAVTRKFTIIAIVRVAIYCAISERNNFFFWFYLIIE